jgi:hypothetical protein
MTSTIVTTESDYESQYKLGRLCNQIIRNLCVSIIAEKHNLKAIYSSSDRIYQLGIELFSGDKEYTITAELTDDNFFHFLTATEIRTNLFANHHFFQTKAITNYLYNYLQIKCKENIIAKNPFKDRYGNNNDCFVHIRLTDVADKNPGIHYYLSVLHDLSFDRLFIASDDFDHLVVQQIMNIYPNSEKVLLDEVKTIQFGSTNKHIVLSHGSFSAMIGYMSFDSNVYFSVLRQDSLWHGDMFSIPGWNEVGK